MSPETRLPIRQQVDVELARRRARQSAIEAGLTIEQAAEWSLVASELATNLMRYARGGSLAIGIEREQRASLVIDSEDEGPGIANIAEAMTEGFSTGGSLGGGLTTVSHFSDDVRIDTSPSGTSILVRRWLS
jgi:serine/threonine-protein kinase RsbT